MPYRELHLRKSSTETFDRNGFWQKSTTFRQALFGCKNSGKHLLQCLCIHALRGIEVKRDNWKCFHNLSYFLILFIKVRKNEKENGASLS